jgi:hypothetical protein
MSLIGDRVQIVVNFVEFHVVKHSENIIMMVSQLRVITIVRKAILFIEHEREVVVVYSTCSTHS